MVTVPLRTAPYSGQMRTGSVGVLDIGDRYEIRFAGSPLLLRYISKIPSATFDKKGGCWYVDKKDELFVKEFCDFVIKRKLADSVDRVGDTSGFADRMASLRYPHGLLVEPYPFQTKGIQYMLDHRRTFNCDDMGCGKTLETITAVHIAKAFPCLVVSPAAMKITWRREFQRFTGRTAVVLDDFNRDKWQGWCMTHSCDVFITNYESVSKFLFRRIGPKIGRYQRISDYELLDVVGLFRSVVIDESHRCKDGSTLWAKYLERICDGKEFVYLLTGTPVVTTNKDLIEQLRIMGRLDDFGGARRFSRRYCQPGTPPEMLQELNWRLWETCFFRRDKTQVLKELPEKVRQYNVVELDNRERYEKAENDLIEYLQKYEEATDEQLRRAMRGYVIVRINVLRRVCAEGKLNEALDFIRDYQERRIKLIVFTAHKSIVTAVTRHFREAVTITGSDSPDEKQTAVDRFQNDAECRLAVVNIRSGGVGLTLTASSNVLFIEFPWTAADCDQCECRSHRNGQRQLVNVTYLLGRDTYDERMYEIIQQERENAGLVTGATDSTEERMIDRIKNIYKIRSKE